MAGTVYLFGAGASHGYCKSKKNVHPPLAKNYFSTFEKLGISADLEVKIGFIVNYIKETRGISYEDQPTDFDENIEDVFAELDTKLRKSFKDKKAESADSFVNKFGYVKAYDQFIFWFSHVLNEIQNGDICPIYSKLIESSAAEDTFITFNWDTLLDRALYNTGKWHPDNGYGIKFSGILDKEWKKISNAKSEYKLLKLHGSTNWFGPYITRHLQTGSRALFSDEDNCLNRWCILDGTAWFDTYKDRWRPDYEPFSYFFCPNDPLNGMPLMPIIIPPTAVKQFQEYDDIFIPIWEEAKQALEKAEKLVIIGYSFPKTDSHAFELLNNFIGTSEGKTIEIIDPYPACIEERIKKFIGEKAVKLIIHNKTLSDYLKISSKVHEIEDSEGYKLEHEENFYALDIDDRKKELLGKLCHLNLQNCPLDVTTHDGKVYLNCKVAGEFASHIKSAFYSRKTIEYRITNIPFEVESREIVKLSINDILILFPLPLDGIKDEDIESADPSSLPSKIKKMVIKGYHCKNKQEEEYFIKRFIAA